MLKTRNVFECRVRPDHVWVSRQKVGYRVHGFEHAAASVTVAMKYELFLIPYKLNI